MGDFGDVSWHHVTLSSRTPDGALAAAAAYTLEGRPVGTFAVWQSEEDSEERTFRVDARLADPHGVPCTVSWVRSPDGVTMDFDDPAVVQATRDALALPAVHARSTLITGAMRFAGAITVARDERRRWLADDPFARLLPRQILRVDGGVFGSMPSPTGPVHQRYGAGNPWPWDRF
ncbi:MAG: hypothetical protein KY469_19775 [Actinobacteria bacterium]|nr:hypothetical protein [Actinomycetota bacterium]